MEELELYLIGEQTLDEAVKNFEERRAEIEFLRGERAFYDAEQPAKEGMDRLDVCPAEPDCFYIVYVSADYFGILV